MHRWLKAIGGVMILYGLLVVVVSVFALDAEVWDLLGLRLHRSWLQGSALVAVIGGVLLWSVGNYKDPRGHLL